MGKIQQKRGGRIIKKPQVKFNFPYTKDNFKIFYIGLIVILFGYILMAFGMTEEPAVESGKWNNFFSIVVAPFLLVIGYAVIIPYAILKSSKKNKENE